MGTFDRGDRSEAELWDFDFETDGAVFGFDYLERGSWFAGLAFGYLQTDATGDTPGNKVSNEMWIISGYGSLRPVPDVLAGLRLSADAFYGWGDGEEAYSSSAFQGGQGLDSRVMGADLVASYGVGIGSFSVSPEIGFSYLRSEFQGGDLDFGLHAGSHYSERVTGSVGLTVDADFALGRGRLQPRVRLRWLRALHQRANDLVLRTSTFSSAWELPDRDNDYYSVGGGVIYQLSQRLQVQAMVDHLLGYDELEATTFGAELTLSFR
jgi:outer membrane autotransporter protein